MRKKIIELNELEGIINQSKEEGKKIVFTNGCFDILHIGHIHLLKQARKFGDILVIGLNSDSSVRDLKGKKRPIIPENERAELLAALEVTDYITIFTEKTACRVLEVIKPDVYVKGGDYSPTSLPEWPVVERNGGQIRIIPLEEGRSTTNIINRIRDK